LAEGTDAINAQRDRWCTTWRDVWRALSLLQGYFRMAQALIKLDRNIEVTFQRAVAASCMPCRGVPPAVRHGARRSHRLGVVATWGSCSTTPTR